MLRYDTPSISIAYTPLFTFHHLCRHSRNDTLTCCAKVENVLLAPTNYDVLVIGDVVRDPNKKV